MSTVPETVAAASLGMEVFAVALCTNPAAGLSLKELTHHDVKLEAEAAGPRFVMFMEHFITDISLVVFLFICLFYFCYCYCLLLIFFFSFLFFFIILIK